MPPPKPVKPAEVKRAEPRVKPMSDRLKALSKPRPVAPKEVPKPIKWGLPKPLPPGQLPSYMKPLWKDSMNSSWSKWSRSKPHSSYSWGSRSNADSTGNTSAVAIPSQNDSFSAHADRLKRAWKQWTTKTASLPRIKRANTSRDRKSIQKWLGIIKDRKAKKEQEAQRVQNLLNDFFKNDP